MVIVVVIALVAVAVAVVVDPQGERSCTVGRVRYFDGKTPVCATRENTEVKPNEAVQFIIRSFRC